MKEIFMLLKNRQILLSSAKVFVSFSALSLLLSWLVTSLSDNAHVSRIESYQYNPETVSAELPIVVPLLASHKSTLQDFDIRDKRIDLQGEYDSLAVRRLRTISSRNPILGTYESYWDLFRWELVTYDYDSTRFYFGGWLSLADKDAVDPEYGTEELYEGTDLSYERYKVNISEGDSYYYYGSSPDRINPTRFSQAIAQTLTPAIDQYIATGAYGVAAELHNLRWDLMESYHLKAELFSAQSANRLMLLRILFSKPEDNYSHYDDFRYLYDFISRFEWMDEQTNRRFGSAHHACIAKFLDAANGIHVEEFEVRPHLFVQRIRDFRSDRCAANPMLSELSELLELKAVILALAEVGDLENIERLAASEYQENLETIEWHEKFSPRAFRSLHDDWVEYIEDITVHVGQVLQTEEVKRGAPTAPEDVDLEVVDEAR